MTKQMTKKEKLINKVEELMPIMQHDLMKRVKSMKVLYNFLNNNPVQPFEDQEYWRKRYEIFGECDFGNFKSNYIVTLFNWLVEQLETSEYLEYEIKLKEYFEKNLKEDDEQDIKEYEEFCKQTIDDHQNVKYIEEKEED